MRYSDARRTNSFREDELGAGNGLGGATTSEGHQDCSGASDAAEVTQSGADHRVSSFLLASQFVFGLLSVGLALTKDLRGQTRIHTRDTGG